jgi:hypothetical protein
MLQLQFILLPAFGLFFTIAGIVLTLIFRRYDFDLLDTPIGVFFGTIFSWGIALILIITNLCVLFPYQAKYLTYTEHQGIVNTVTNRFNDGTGNLSGNLILTLKNSTVPLVVTDDRLQSVKVGQYVDLTCSIAFTYGGADETDCFIRSFGK